MVELPHKPRVAVVDGYAARHVGLMFTARGWDTVDSIATADLICFTGGADIGPNLYGEKAQTYTHPDTRRDEGEIEIFKRASALSKPFVGICRGAQLLNVLGGGKMVQDVTRHGSPHDMKEVNPAIKDVRKWRTFLKMTSLHHQMMIPGTKATVIAVTNVASEFLYGPGTDIVIREKDELDWDNPEVVWYPGIRSLCWQGHPESGDLEERAYFFELIHRFIGLAGRNKFATRAMLSNEQGIPFDDAVEADPVG